MADMPAIETLRERLPEELKDLRLNLPSVLSGEQLPGGQALGVAAAAARFARSGELVAAIESDLRAGHPDEAEALLADAVAAAGLMGMNTVYYRFRHMIGKESYNSRPARLRMQRLAPPAPDKPTLELMSLACAAIAGCEACIRNHEGSLVGLGISEEACHDAVRIAAVISGVAVGLG